MKKLFLIMSMLLLASIAVFADSNDETSSSFRASEIANAEDLIKLSQTSTEWGGSFIIIDDIFFPEDPTQFDWNGDGEINWEGGDSLGFSPIGIKSDLVNKAFTGVLNGHYHKIENLYINRPDEDYVGFLGNVKNATVRSIGLINANIKAKNISAGFAAYCSNSLLVDCYVTGEVFGNNVVGSLIGRSDTNSVIEYCYSELDLTANNQVGGLIGLNYSSEVNSSYNMGDVNANNKVGGLIGENIGSNISDSYSDGNVTAKDTVGGLIGCNSALSNINNCSSEGDISGEDLVGGLIGLNMEISNLTLCFSKCLVSGNEFIGGFIGQNTASDVQLCYSDSEVSGEAYVGGFIGVNASAQYHTTHITNSYSLSNISRNYASIDTVFGGFCGINNTSKIENCYVAGNVIYDEADDPTNRGFIAVDVIGDVQNNFFDSQAFNQTTAIGATAKTTAEMKTKETFTNVGWDFLSIWLLYAITNDGYPDFRWNSGYEPLLIKEFTPEDNESRFGVGDTLMILFNNDIFADEGNISLFESNGEVAQIFNIKTDVEIEYNLLLIPLKENLKDTTDYYVNIEQTCFHDEDETYFTGIADDTTWNFRIIFSDTTEATMPEGWINGESGIIHNLAELRWLSNSPEAWDEDWMLDNDIDAYETKYWNDSTGFKPIGDNHQSPFTGSFDGQNYSISNLYIDDIDLDYAGLFGRINNSIIENLSVFDCNIYANNNVGGIAGHTDSSTTIRGCDVNGKIRGYGAIGGLVGWNNCSIIENSHSSGEISGHSYLGGAAGLNYSNSTIKSTYSTAKILNIAPIGGGGFMGGLVGRMTSSSVEDCYSTGEVIGLDCVGGFIGYSNEISSIVNCYSTGDVTSFVTSGGFVGCFKDTDVSNCHSTGNVSGVSLLGGFTHSCQSSEINKCYSTGNVYGSENIGGFVNKISGSTISNCFSLGNVTRTDSTAETFASFCIVNDSSIIKHCYSIGSVIYENADNPTDKGFVAIDKGGIFINNFFDVEYSNQATAIGASPKNTAEMKTESTFTNVGWNFTNLWYISEDINDGYPFFIDFPNSVQEELPISEKSDFYCYPNLVSNGDIINIKLPENRPHTILYVYDIQGRLIDKINDNMIIIDNKYNSRGMYFIKSDTDYTKFIVE